MINIISIELLTKELKSCKHSLSKSIKCFEQKTISEQEHLSHKLNLEFKISLLESDIETLKNKYNE